MDILSRRPHPQFCRNQPSPKLEDYDELVAQLQKPREQNNVALSQRRGFFQFQHPTTEPLNAENPEQNPISPHTRQRHRDPAGQILRSTQVSKPGQVSMDQHSWAQNGHPPGASHPQDPQDDEINAWYMASQPFTADQHLDHGFAGSWFPQNGDVPFSQQQDTPFWRANWSEMAAYDIGHAQAMGVASAAGMGPSLSALIMPTLNSAVIGGAGDEGSSILALERGLGGRDAPEDSNAFEQHEQHRLVQQPMAIPGTDINQLSNVARLEQMMPSHPDQRTQPADGPSASPEGQQTFSPDSPTPSKSPRSITESNDRLSSMSFIHPDSRRPSVTNDLTYNVSNIQLQQSQSSEDLSGLQPMMFKKPSFSGRSTLAERRRQQTPNGINTQRPHGLNIGRTVSSSAINQMPNGTKFPTSPHGTLRRNKSSNVVLSGRIQKSAANSARNSPMVASFSDAMSMQSSQATPQPPALQTHPSMALASPHQMSDSHPEMLPSSASSTAMFTPGIHTGESMPLHSFGSTPVTTPYGFAHPQGYSGPHIPPPSEIPQSAPAYMLQFKRPNSPPGLPTMPNTPANGHFPEHVSPHTQMFNAPMPMQHMQHHMAIVPSQHGLPENPGFMPPQNPEFLHAGFHDAYLPQNPYSHPHFGVYHEYDLWARGHLMAPKDLEVKFDPCVEKLTQSMRQGTATIIPIEKRDFSFQNTSYSDMKKQHPTSKS